MRTYLNLACWGALLGLAITTALPAMSANARRLADTVIPTTFESGHFYAVPELANGKKMRLLLDTGGGTLPTLWVNQAQADSLGLKADHTCEGDGRIYQVASPIFAVNQRLPELSAFCRGVIILPNENASSPSGQIVPMYFAGGVWTFDYSKRQVVLRGHGWHPPKDAHKTLLGLKRLPSGINGGWPRIIIRVDGEELNMLLDTGATSKPTAQALKEDPRSTTDGMGVGSYIDESTMARWRRKHPEWKVVDNGDALIPGFSRIIRVPHVEVVGWDVGPVWFIERPDSAFHTMMASLMDEPPEGSVGANVFEHFRMTIDYKKKAAWFECASECSASSVPAPQKIRLKGGVDHIAH
jgi:hypothetical protein